MHDDYVHASDALSIVESATDQLFIDKSGRECRGRRTHWASGRPIEVILCANTSMPMNCGRHGQVAALAGCTCGIHLSGSFDMKCSWI